MALKKNIKLDNGISVSYHRIAMIDIELNQQMTILVISYIDINGRIYEKDYSNGKIDNPIFPYKDSKYIHIPYNESLDMLNGSIILKAYAWLKSQPIFEGAEDV